MVFSVPPPEPITLIQSAPGLGELADLEPDASTPSASPPRYQYARQ